MPGGFIASAISDHLSRKLVLQIGVIITTLFTLLIPLVQSAEQLIVLRLLTGIGLGFAVTAPFPIAAELMPAQHRRTYSAINEIMLASAFTLLPLIGLLLAHDPNGFRLIALPGGLALFVVPVVLQLVLPDSPRWNLRKGRPQAAVDLVNQIIRRAGGRVPPVTVTALGANPLTTREEPPPYWALFARGQLRWTVVGIVSGTCAGTAYFLIAVLLPKALIDQGSAVTLSFGVSTIVFLATIPGKGFNAYLMEIIGRRWTIAFALTGAIPGLFLMAIAHLAGPYATVVMSAGAMVTGFTVLSAFPATRMYLSEQFPTALRGRGNIFGESFGRLFAGVLAPFSDGTSHRVAEDLLWDDPGDRSDRRLYPADLRSRDNRPTGNVYRGGSRAGLTGEGGLPLADNPTARHLSSGLVADDGAGGDAAVRGYGRDDADIAAGMKILLVEDNERVAQFIRKGLTEEGHVVDHADNGRDGLFLAATGHYDALVLDRMLPGGIDGLGIVESLRRTADRTPILILSALAEVDDRIRGLRAGGDDYLTKPFAFGELLARLEALARRSQGVEIQTVLTVADLRIDLLSHRVTRDGKPIQLQRREFKLLEYLARHVNQVVTRTMLLENVWEHHFDPQTNVIDVHISKLRQKIDAGAACPLLHTVRGVGYRLGTVA